MHKENAMNENRDMTTTAETAVECTRERRVVQPRCDIWESEAGVTLVADMPGVDDASLDVTLENSVLKIEGRTRFEAPEGYTLRFAEFEPVDYERSFVLSRTVDADRITASMKNGRLTVSVPKAQPAQKRIAVQVT
jgi:HSP20 family molecular chaperone IbpA